MLQLLNAARMTIDYVHAWLSLFTYKHVSFIINNIFLVKVRTKLRVYFMVKINIFIITYMWEKNSTSKQIWQYKVT